MRLRPYQTDLTYSIYQTWGSGRRRVLAVLPTGAGKTVVFSHALSEHKGASCAIAHRQELVSQISLALAREGVRHRIVGPKSVVKLCVSQHVSEVGRGYYDPSATCAVAGVDTLIRRKDSLRRWADSVTLWVIDEAHHVLPDNKWGAACSMFPSARGLGVTATPTRADGKALDKTFDELIVGPGMRELIERGYLTDYRIFCPRSDIDLSQVSISKSGDYDRVKLTSATRKSHIVGDVVSHYIKIAKGKRGVTFATDVQTAKDLAESFRAAGIPAEALDATTPDAERIACVKRFRQGEILQLVNCDLFGEGFDLPAIEVVSMARATQSYGLYVQQFGRALRPMEGKDKAIIIDHVGNVQRHGLPDRDITWSLAGREKMTNDNAGIKSIKVCQNCTAVYYRIFTRCPYCGYKPVPSQRSAPEFVDGDLTELSGEALEALRAGIKAADIPLDAYRAKLKFAGIPTPGVLANCKRLAANQAAQKELRRSIATWAGYQRALGISDAQSYKTFYLSYGIDVLSAQALKEADAIKLKELISGY